MNCPECKEKHIAAALGYLREYASGNSDRLLDAVSELVLLEHHYCGDAVAEQIRQKRKSLRSGNMALIPQMCEWLRSLWQADGSKRESAFVYAEPPRLTYADAPPEVLEATKASVEKYALEHTDTLQGQSLLIPSGLILLRKRDMRLGLPDSIPQVKDKICCSLERQLKYAPCCICPDAQALAVLQAWLAKQAETAK